MIGLPLLRAHFRSLATLGVAVVLTAGATQASPAERRPVEPEWGPPSTPNRYDGDLRDLPAPRAWQVGDPIKDIPQRFYKPLNPPAVRPPLGHDPLVDVQRGAGGEIDPEFSTPSHSFPGQGFTGVNPADTMGDVGPNHFIQAINAASGAVIQIFDKAAPQPNPLVTFTLDSLGMDECESGFGDPIVLYDRQADRWLISEFARTANALCVYISQTGDPVSGGWFGYEFRTPTFPDYPKYSVWATDANGGEGSYIVTANDGGPGIYALNRAAMLTGAPSTFIRMEVPPLPGFGVQSPTPAEPDGPNGPPATAPALIMRHRDTEIHNGPLSAPGDVLEMWEFQVDWLSVANTTLTQVPDIHVTDFDSTLCGNAFTMCFAQPNALFPKLMPIQEVLYHRLQYYNHGNFETIVGTHVVDVAIDRGGLRWFELRRSGPANPWILFQEGTYSLDETDRWMASIAMDRSENIAIAYNVVKETIPFVYPGLRYTGRLADDPVGRMTQPETVIVSGGMSNGSFRYGDYAAMGLDPADDCTFWFTGMYNPSSQWRTYAAAFRFAACGCDVVPLPLTAVGVNVGDNAVEISWNDSEIAEIVEYQVRRSRTPGGPYETIATVPDASPGVGGGAGGSVVDTDVSGTIPYYYVVVASNGEGCRSGPSEEIEVIPTGECRLAPDFDGVRLARTPNEETCALDLSWNAAVAPCGGAVEYDIYRSADPFFTPEPANLLRSGIVGETFRDLDALIFGTTYHYVVRARDTGNDTIEQNDVRTSATAFGELGGGAGLSFADDAGDTTPVAMSVASPWLVEGTGGNFGPGVYALSDYPDDTCAAITTPSFSVKPGDELRFWSRYDIEPHWDKGLVEISTDGGVLWEILPVDYPDNAVQASDACGFSIGPSFSGSGTEWALYGADLDPWAGEVVRLRWILSTDARTNRTLGWLIDDISVAAPPDACTTVTACDENPVVDVLPDGDLLECTGLVPELSAGLTGGQGPFLYQWMKDGQPVEGATEPTFLPTGFGTHSYNVRVRSESCPDEIFDGLETTMTVELLPRFDGLSTVVNAQTVTCGVQLTWEPAVSPCPGPVTYDVYRSLSPDVDATPENLLISGVTGTSYLDQSAVDENVTHYYLVRAVDQTSLAQDVNQRVLSAAPTGPGAGLNFPIAEGFSDPSAFDDWTVTTGPGRHNCGAWDLRLASIPRPTGGSGVYIGAMSDVNFAPDCGEDPATSSTVVSPALDFSFDADFIDARLDFSLYYDDRGGNEFARAEVFDGTQWVELWASTETDLSAVLTFDVLEQVAGNPAFQLRFDYQGGEANGWLTIDDVVLETFIESECFIGQAGPPPAPAGLGGGNPLTAALLTPDSLSVDWDPTCGAADYNLLYGSLDNVATTQLDGSACGLGTSGQFTWNGVPADSLFFLVVGTDGASTESSWGRGTGGERNGPASSGQCGVSLKDATGTCF